MSQDQNDQDDEIEQYLAEKIKHAIDRLGDQQNLVTKLYPFKDEFTKILVELKRKTNPKVKDDWSSIRRSNLYSLNNLVTEWQTTKNQTSLSPKEVYESCDNIQTSLKKIKKEIDGVVQDASFRGDRGNSEASQDPNHPIYERNKEPVYRWSSRHPPRKVHGLEHRVLAMERELLLRNINAPLKVLGVVGSAGIGKTTLCQSIFNRNPVKEHFCPRIWVCLSKQSRDKKDYRMEIVVRMLKCLGIEDEVIDDAENDNVYGLKKLILLLRLNLIGKKYLIVLDDAWNDDKVDGKFMYNLIQKEHMDEGWGEELAYSLPKGCGGAIISSSQSEALLKKMLGTDVNLQYLKRQPDDIIYAIFKDNVVGYGEDEREFAQHLEDLKGEWLKECDGVPLAAKLLAKIARKHPDVVKKKIMRPPGTGAGGGHEIKQVPAGGVRDGGNRN